MVNHILAIESAEPDLRLTLSKDGLYLATHRTTVSEARELLRASRALFEAGQGPTPPTPIELLAFGNEIAQRLLGPLRAALTGLYGRLWLVSADPTWLDLPLEIVPRRDGSFLTEGGRLSLRRASHAPPEPRLDEPVRLKPSPLRVVFLAGTFAGEESASFEEEQAILSQLSNGTNAPMQITCATSGTLRELVDLIVRHQPHIVHLSSRFSMEHGAPRFSFRGPRSSAILDIPSLTTAAFAGRDVSMVIASGVESSPGVMATFCQGLTYYGAVPLALGWPLPVADCLATTFMQNLYARLAGGLGIDASLDQARAELLTDCLSQDWNGQNILYPDFAQPRLYATHPLDTLLRSTARSSSTSSTHSRITHLSSPGQ